MARKDKGHYARKHADGSAVPQELAERLQAAGSEGAVTCAEAFEIAESLGVPPAEVGRAMDLMELRITRCQLGLFGYRPDKRRVEPVQGFSETLAAAVRERLVDGRLPCRAAWEVAREQGVGRMHVAGVCETLGIKITACQLGAFG